MQYTYYLDKSAKKYYCPGCGKKTLVRFIDPKTNQYLAEQYGRCDRELSCGYFLKPNSNKPLVTDRDYHAYIPPSLHTKGDFFDAYDSRFQNNFHLYLSSLFGIAKAIALCKRYLVGTDHTKWKGSTVFWQIDEALRIRAGKVMLYDAVSGKRVKTPFNHINWMHSVKGFKNFNLSQCLFGLHLLSPRLKFTEQSVVRIVESEKTAIIMSGIVENTVWMATGSKSNFKEQLLVAVKKQRVIAYPDKSEYANWKKVADELNVKGYHIIVSAVLENNGLNEGDDLVDLIE